MVGQLKTYLRLQTLEEMVKNRWSRLKVIIGALLTVLGCTFLIMEVALILDHSSSSFLIWDVLCGMLLVLIGQAMSRF